MSFHVAVIPDGNRRWAKTHELPISAGHEAGSKVPESLINTILDLKIDWFTIWGSSISNLTKRSEDEVILLNMLYADGFRQLSKSTAVHNDRIRVRVLGKLSTHLSPEAHKEAKTVMATTREYRNLSFTILLAYDGVSDTVNAVNQLIKTSRKDSALTATTELVRAYLVTRDLPDVDLLIRTGGEPHLSSGFLMWETANAQMVFLSKLWPDFTPQDLTDAVAEYHSRTRRFGT